MAVAVSKSITSAGTTDYINPAPPGSVPVIGEEVDDLRVGGGLVVRRPRREPDV